MTRNPYTGILDQPPEAQLAVFRAVTADGRRAEIAALAEASLWYFLTVILGRAEPPALTPWIADRCRDVQTDPDGHIDLWARFHYKSTIITFAQTLRDLAIDPEQTFGIFSHTKQIARGFHKQLMQEIETNPLLHHLWPDVFYREPRRESPMWSQEAGFVVNRRTNPKEASVESWGLVDGQPTSRHYRTQVYDDVVTLESVSTPDQIAKTTAAWELSLALGTEHTRIRYAGTRYHPNDTYHTIIARGSAVPRVHPATDDGTMAGAPVLIDPAALARYRRDMGPRTFAAQMLLQPVSADTATFREEWLMLYDDAPPPAANMNIWILVDPAGGKAKSARRDDQRDYTVMIALGLAPDQNYYVLPGTVRDRLNLTARADTLFALRRRYHSAQVAYEEYGMQADIAHIQDRQAREHYRFPIHAVGGSMPKMQRIERLVPLFTQGRIWLPRRLPFRAADGTVHDFTHEFTHDEYLPCPVLPHDDMLDCLARLFDVPAKFPAPRRADPAPSRSPAAARTAYDPFTGQPR